MKSDFNGLIRHTLLFLLMGNVWGISSQTHAQIPIFSEEFGTWTDGCPQGWNCITSVACEAGDACFWGRDDSFGPTAKPAAEDCDGWGRYARCNSSQLSFGQFAAMITPEIDLSMFPVTDYITLSFCYINSSLQALDGDGIRVSFSTDGGQNFEAQLLDVSTIYNDWTTISLSVPATYRTAEFQVRIDGLGDNSTGDIGIDQFTVTNTTSLCESEQTSIQTNQPTRICKDTEADTLSFTHSGTGTLGIDYAFLLVNEGDEIVQILSSDSYDFNLLEAGQYRVYGLSYTGSLNVSRGMLLSTISSSICVQLSGNFIAVEVASLSAEISLISDYNGEAISCYGSNDASARVQVVGGQTPFSFMWDNAQTTATATSLNAGTHTVNIIDANGCKSSAAITIDQPSQIKAIPSPTAALCKNSADGSISLSVSGGIGGYTYIWSNGANTATAFGLTPATYSCIISDQNACAITISAEVAEGSDLEVDISTFDATCYGKKDGFIIAEAKKGQAPYIYQWSNGESMAQVFDLQAGTYQLMTTDAAGCTVTSEVQLGQADSLVLTFKSSPDNGTQNGKALVEVSGGTAPYTYKWSTSDTTQQIDRLDDGIYNVTVTDANGCIAVATVAVEENLKLDCLEIHTGFTPNGDGVNEHWYIPCIDAFRQNEVIIFNRWGQELFRMNDYDNSWDGSVNGKRLPDGTYFYIVKLNTPSDKRTFKGTVSIIR